jgi:hypothetical protein
MLKFTDAKLKGGKLVVEGPSKPNPGMKIKHLRFMIAQGAVMVEDEGKVWQGKWKGKTPAGKLKPGSAQGFGLAVMFKPKAPGSFELFTWVEQVEITT